MSLNNNSQLGSNQELCENNYWFIFSGSFVRTCVAQIGTWSKTAATVDDYFEPTDVCRLKLD